MPSSTAHEEQRKWKQAGKSSDGSVTHSKPLVEKFFSWVDLQFESQRFLPSSPMTQALAYAREARAALEAFLADSDVPMDTHHLERTLRAIPLGMRLGAQ